MADLSIPFFLKEIMNYIDDDTGEVSQNRTIFFVFLILIVSIVVRIARENYFFYQQGLAYNASQAMVGLIYK